MLSRVVLKDIVSLQDKHGNCLLEPRHGLAAAMLAEIRRRVGPEEEESGEWGGGGGHSRSLSVVFSFRLNESCVGTSRGDVCQTQGAAGLSLPHQGRFWTRSTSAHSHTEEEVRSRSHPQRPRRVPHIHVAEHTHTHTNTHTFTFHSVSAFGIWTSDVSHWTFLNTAVCLWLVWLAEGRLWVFRSLRLWQ